MTKMVRSYSLVPVVLLGTIANRSIPRVAASEFNFEISQRVHERLEDYMQDPQIIARIISEYRQNYGFPHNMTAPDRDAYLRLNDALMTLYPHFESIYYGLEDGVFVGHSFASRIAKYREPGESGFQAVADDTPPDMMKHLISCVDDSGNQEDCIMSPGGSYVECIDGCALAKCPDEDSQRDCGSETDTPEELTECEAKIKWCKQYVRKAAPDDTGTVSSPSLGYVPRSTYCIDETGVPSQTSGSIMKKGTDVRGNCYFKDGVTLVDRSLSGSYAFCGGNGNGVICDNTFVGAYQDRDYDPRWRGWYEDTRALQRRNWSPPYTFFTTLSMGITYCEPIYSIEEGRHVFAGVVAVDYTFDNITEFLVENYNNSSTTVAVFESDPPNYLVASSTGTKAAAKVCSNDEEGDCKAVRISISNVSETPMDTLLARAFARQVEEDFPETDLVSIKADDRIDSTAYVSQTQPFNVPDVDLQWTILIMSPASLSSDDTILKGDIMFPILIAVALIGFVICLTLCFQFYRHRTEQTIIASDWRFTAAFILGCAILNTASLSFLGRNTTPLCILRMWMFHLFFALALSPLLVKTWRMVKLVGSSTIQRVKITHAKAALLTLPIIMTQVVILLIFTFVDPSKQVEIIEMSGSDVQQRLVCAHGTNAFFIVEMIFEGGLVLLGCILAFKSRNLKGDFGESKQLILAMYNIAVVGSVVVIIVNVMATGQASKRILIAIGILWVSVFSGCAFTIPRLLQVHDRRDFSEKRVLVSGIASSNVAISSASSGSNVHFTRKHSDESDHEAVLDRVEEEVFSDT